MAAEWIEWGGGERPVPPDALVDVRFRCGDEVSRIPAQTLMWDSTLAEDVPYEYDIVSYRRTYS